VIAEKLQLTGYDALMAMSLLLRHLTGHLVYHFLRSEPPPYLKRTFISKDESRTPAKSTSCVQATPKNWNSGTHKVENPTSVLRIT
jgi:hypothetical protein